MKKQLFTLLTLLVMCVTGAWGSTVSDLTTITSATTIIANTLNNTSELSNGALYADGKLLCIGGCGYSANKGEVSYGGTKYASVYQIKNSRQLVLKIGFDATITVVGSTHDSRAWRLGTTSAGNEIATGKNGDNYATGNIDGSSTPQIVYINASGDLYLAAIIITANSSTAPTITASSTAAIKATESGKEVTEDISVIGKNLTGSTLSATLTPTVTGLSVTLDPETITNGSISTTATLHYTQTVNASGSTTLTLSDGTTTKNVTINYKALVVPTELVAISEATTFELKNTGEELADVTSEDYVVLADAGSEASFAENLAVKGVGTLNVTWRSDAVQAGFFKFKTTIPGTVTVKFSDTGGTAGGTRAPRYANVNGTRSDVSSNGSSGDGAQVTCSPIAVEAGEVIIKGEQYNSDNENYTDNQIRIFTITFTPAVTATITSAGWATLYTDKALDFSGVKGLTAYTATVTNNTVTLNKVQNNVPANTGVVLEGAADTYYIPVVASSETAKGDLQGSATDATAFDAYSGYTLYILTQNGNDVQFNPCTSGSIAAGKAFLKVATDNNNSGGAKALSVVFANDPTGISTVNATETAQPVKRIVNGKLVIEKNGKHYNAAGAEF